MVKKPEADETIRLLDEIATFKPTKKAQLAAKKISEKYKKIREANAKKPKKIKDDRTLEQLIDDDFIPLETGEDIKNYNWCSKKTKRIKEDWNKKQN